MTATMRQMQIFRLDFASAEAEMPAAGGSVTAPERFERLAWGAIGLDPHGLPVLLCPLSPQAYSHRRRTCQARHAHGI